MYLYLDESGDLGFNFEMKKSSKKFVITILLCLNDNTRKEFKKAVQRTIKKKIHRKKKNKQIQELKGTRTHIDVKKYFLKNVKDEDWRINWKHYYR